MGIRLTPVAHFGRALVPGAALAGDVMLGLSGCASGAETDAGSAPGSTRPTVSAGPADPTASIPTVTTATPSATPTSAPAAGPTPENPEAPVSTDIALSITVNGTTVAAVLPNNAASASLAAQLPLELSFTDYGGQEKIAGLPAALNLDGMPAGGSAEPGTVGYYAPDQDLVLYYDSVGYYDGIIPLGTFDDVAAVRDAPAFVATVTNP